MKKPRKSKTLSIRELTSEIYNSKKLSGKIDSIEILNTWNEITNKLIQDRTEKVSISEEKIVFIKVNSSPLRNELENNKKNLLKKIVTKHNKVQDIVFY